MTIEAIETRAAAEARVFEIAKQVRQLLDTAAKEITLPDDRDVCEEILELVTED